MTSTEEPVRADVRHQLGATGEQVAEGWLTARGMEVLDRNWRCRGGEIDLVLRDGPDAVICEVKARRSMAFGGPLEAITRAKLARLRRLAGQWAQEHPGHGALRLDVVGLLAHADGTWSITHLRGVG